MSGFNPGSTQPPGVTMTDNKPAAPGLVEAAQALLANHDELHRLLNTNQVKDEDGEKFAAASKSYPERLEALRAALASHPVPSAPEPKLPPRMVRPNTPAPREWTAIYADGKADGWNACLDAIAAPASAPEPSTLTTEALNEAWKRGYKVAKEEAALATSAHPVPAAAPAGEPTDPLDAKIPADFKAAGATFRKGLPMRLIAQRMERLWEAAFGPMPTPEQQAANLAMLQGATLPASPEPATLATAARVAATSLDTLIRYHGVSQRPTPEEIRTALDALHALRETLR